MATQALIDILGALSVKRRNGVLRIALPAGGVELGFVGGKIIAVEHRVTNLARDICTRLLRAGVINQQVLRLFESASVTLPQLHDLLITKQFVTADQLQSAKRAHDLDVLHSLGYLDDVTF